MPITVNTLLGRYSVSFVLKIISRIGVFIAFIASFMGQRHSMSIAPIITAAIRYHFGIGTGGLIASVPPITKALSKKGFLIRQ